MSEMRAKNRNEGRAMVRTALADGILRVTMANPPANALSLEMIARLQGAFDQARDDSGVRVIVLAAEGKLFCAGHDLKEMTAHRADADRGRAFFTETMAACATLMQTIVRHPRPVIAEVAGVATAAGCQLVASCDLAIATTEATFATPGVNIGLFCSTPMVAVTRTVAPKHAMQLLLTGEAIDADTAFRMGLVNQVVDDDALAAATVDLAAAVASKPPSVVAAGKATYRRQMSMPVTGAYEIAGRAMVEGLAQPDAVEGIGAFLEKRAPTWR